MGEGNNFKNAYIYLYLNDNLFIEYKESIWCGIRVRRFRFTLIDLQFTF